MEEGEGARVCLEGVKRSSEQAKSNLTSRKSAEGAPLRLVR